MEKEFVEYEQAVALKELGFDEPCFGYFGDAKELRFDRFVDKNTQLLKAPLYQQAFRWFREKYNLSGVVLPFNEGLFDYRVYSTKEGKHLYGSSEYDNYEAAEPACLTKLIEIVKTK